MPSSSAPEVCLGKIFCRVDRIKMASLELHVPTHVDIWRELNWARLRQRQLRPDPARCGPLVRLTCTTW